MSNPQNSFINLANSRTEEQRQIMQNIEKDGVCPFCQENLTKYHKKDILREGNFWLLTDNQWPYDKIKHQLLAIHKEHISHISEMNPEAGKELIELFQEEARKRNISGGGIAIRFGKRHSEGNYGSTVEHIHAHLIEPDLEKLNETEAWKFTFGKPKDYKKG